MNELTWSYIIVIVLLLCALIGLVIFFLKLVAERDKLEFAVTDLKQENRSLRSNHLTEIVNSVDTKTAIKDKAFELGQEAATRIAENVTELARTYISLEISNRFGELSQEQDAEIIKSKLEAAKKAVSKE